MDYSYLNKEEYSGIQLYSITDNNNELPFFIIKMQKCSVRIHRHKYIQIIYMSKGSLKHVINKNAFEVHKGDIFIIPPYVPHYFINDSKEGFEIIELEFSPEFINEQFSSDIKSNSFMDFAYLEPFLVTENEVKPRMNLKGNIQIEVEKIFNEILKEYETRDSDFELCVKARLLTLLVIVGREFKKSLADSETQIIFDRHKDALNCALEFIYNNYSRQITFEEAAKVAMLSHSYFRYFFKQLTGKTFIEYLNDLRIAKAIELLEGRKDMRVLEICYEVGFNNVNHFNRVFRQITGLTPMYYRKST